MVENNIFRKNTLYVVTKNHPQWTYYTNLINEKSDKPFLFWRNDYGKWRGSYGISNLIPYADLKFDWNFRNAHTHFNIFKNEDSKFVVETNKGDVWIFNQIEKLEAHQF